MKKLVFILAFMLTGTVAFATNDVEITEKTTSEEVVLSYACFQSADAVASFAGAHFGLSYAEEHDVFLLAYDRCMSMQE